MGLVLNAAPTASVVSTTVGGMAAGAAPAAATEERHVCEAAL